MSIILPWLLSLLGVNSCQAMGLEWPGDEIIAAGLRARMVTDGFHEAAVSSSIGEALCTLGVDLPNQ